MVVSRSNEIRQRKHLPFSPFHQSLCAPIGRRVICSASSVPPNIKANTHKSLLLSYFAPVYVSLFFTRSIWFPVAYTQPELMPLSIPGALLLGVYGHQHLTGWHPPFLCVHLYIVYVGSPCFIGIKNMFVLLWLAIISGLMPPVMESASEDGEADAEDQDEVDLYDTADEGEAADEGTRATDVLARTTKKAAGPNDPVAPHRSPSPSSACHSLEWDSNGDDFFGHDCRTHNIKAFSS